MARLAFFGTPSFAASSLQAVHNFCTENGHEIVLVVSQTDKPKNRGKHVEITPVKTLAQSLGLHVQQPSTLKKGSEDGDAFFEDFKKLQIDLSIVVAYGRLIPQRFLEIKKQGFVNVHASLLPRWRGAAPIQRAILAGDNKSGVCIMDLLPELDTGDVYMCAQIPIESSDDAISLHDKAAALGAATLCKALPGILEGSLGKSHQSKEGITYAHMLRKEEGLIDFSKSASDIINHIRGMQGWPSAYSYHNGKGVKFFPPCIYQQNDNSDAKPGTVLAITDELLIKTGDGLIGVKELQVEGKKRMELKQLLNGYSVRPGDVFKST